MLKLTLNGSAEMKLEISYPLQHTQKRI